MPSSTMPLDGRAHAIFLEGYDDDAQMFKFWNNWGSRWGDSGYGYLPYQYFTLFVQEAWGHTWPTGFQCPDNMQHEFICLERGFTNSLGNPWFIIDLWKKADGTRVGWCMATVRDHWFEIEDFFIRPDFVDNLAHRRLLLQRMIRMALKQPRPLPIRFWISHADTHHQGANFRTINDVIRDLNLTVMPSGVTWAAYRAEKKLSLFVPVRGSVPPSAQGLKPRSIVLARRLHIEPGGPSRAQPTKGE